MVFPHQILWGCRSVWGSEGQCLLSHPRHLSTALLTSHSLSSFPLQKRHRGERGHTSWLALPSLSHTLALKIFTAVVTLQCLQTLFLFSFLAVLWGESWISFYVCDRFQAKITQILQLSLHTHRHAHTHPDAHTHYL